MAGLSPRGRNLASATLANMVERGRLIEQHKLVIANLVNQRKDILFGKRSDTITPAARKAAWEDIMEECRLVYGFEPVAPGKDYLHMRNHIWSDMKSAVMKKIRQGSEVYSALDIAVLEVIGDQETPITSGVRHAGQQPSDVILRSRPMDPTADEFHDDHVDDQPSVLEVHSTVPRRSRLIPPRRAPAATYQSEPPRRQFLMHRRPATPVFDSEEPPPQQRGHIRRAIRTMPADHDPPTMVTAQRIVGLLPVVDSHSVRNTSGSIALQSISMPQKRRLQRQRDFTEDEEGEEDNQEIASLKKQLLMEKIENFRLMNEKLKLEIEAMRPPVTSSS